MAKQRTFKGVIENAYGKPLPSPISYSGSFEELAAGDEIPAKERPDEKDLLAYVNNKRKANARQKSMQEALTAAGIEKPTLEDPEEAFRQMVKLLVTAVKMDEATARQNAYANLNIPAGTYDR